MAELLYTSSRRTTITVSTNGNKGICCNVNHGRHRVPSISKIVGFFFGSITDRAAEVVPQQHCNKLLRPDNSEKTVRSIRFHECQI